MTEAPTLQEQVDQQTAASQRGFSAFAGVFTPTLLTILGVIMYLRLGWVVGNVGLLRAWVIILIAFGITGFTGLSLSSIATNIRIGAGGAYSMISQSLGLEVGGSISIPLYVSQGLAISMYIFGFREGWRYIFPDHPALLVDLAVFLIVFGIAYASAGLAFRIQYVILAIIIGSLLSVAAAAALGSMQVPIDWTGPSSASLLSEFGNPDFWIVFAVFFPAATGIMAGANMSGELRDPKRSIPAGTMAAIALSLVIYLALAYWLAHSATTAELLENFTIMVDKAAFGPLVLAGLLGATFSSALTSAVGAPRILQALGQHGVLPGGKWIAETSEGGEPRNAMLITAGIVIATLMVRDLNAVAPMITMFFLITYAMVNVVVVIEQSLGLVSFRPLLRVPRVLPAIGAAGCLFVMFVVNPAFSFVAVIVVLTFYGILLQRSLDAPFGDVRSGLFVAVAEWAARRVSDLSAMQERAWKPNLLVPVLDPRALRGTFRFIHDVTYPKGTVRLLGLHLDGSHPGLREELANLSMAFRQENVFASWSLLDAEGFEAGVVTGMQTLSGSFFRPNVLFLPEPQGDDMESAYRRILEKATENRIGLLLFADHPVARLGRRRMVNIWVRDQSPDWELSMDIGNLDLAILVGYKLKVNWEGHIRLITSVEDSNQVDNAREYLDNLTQMARVPQAEIHVVEGTFSDLLGRAPTGDINIFGLPDELDTGWLRSIVDETSSACVFVRDSGEESALA